LENVECWIELSTNWISNIWSIPKELNFKDLLSILQKKIVVNCKIVNFSFIKHLISRSKLTRNLGRWGKHRTLGRSCNMMETEEQLIKCSRWQKKKISYCPFKMLFFHSFFSCFFFFHSLSLHHWRLINEKDFLDEAIFRCCFFFRLLSIFL
jgi:hypothetical protein